MAETTISLDEAQQAGSEPYHRRENAAAAGERLRPRPGDPGE
jgi:hypothetical protein